MFYQYTGQPGHGKTVLGIEFALEMKEKADRLHAEEPSKHPVRELYVCNVRDFNHGSCGALELTPDEVKNWHNEPRFDHAIILVDEAYEHGMFPRRPPGRPVPEHVQLVAKHRHRGIDFVMICQSPKKQMDDFLHDLIEEHYHIRRRYGLPFVNIRRWDRFEPNPEKADPLTTKRRGYPKHIFKLYTSTKYDTSEKRVPWFYWAALAIVIAFAVVAPLTWNRVSARLNGETRSAKEPERMRADGAPATAAKPAAQGTSRDRGTTEDYVSSLMPRVPGQPWSAPIYDGLSVSGDPPRLFCMATAPGTDGDGVFRGASCSCITEQGTRYAMPMPECNAIAINGQYEPFLKREQKGIQAQPSQSPQSKESIGASMGARVSGAVVEASERPLGAFPESVQNTYSGR